MAFSDPQDELERFVSKIRSLCDRNAETSEIVALLMGALKGDVEAGEISDLTWTMAHQDMKEAIFDEARDAVYQEVKEQLDVQFRDKQEVLEKEYKSRITKYEDDLRLGVIYEVIRKKLLSQTEFLEHAIAKVREDLLRSKNSDSLPVLYQATLEKIDQAEMIQFLADNFKEELLEQYREDIKRELLRERHEELKKEVIAEIKDELKNDGQFVEQARTEAIQEIARTIFD